MEKIAVTLKLVESIVETGLLFILPTPTGNKLGGKSHEVAYSKGTESDIKMFIYCGFNLQIQAYSSLYIYRQVNP